MAQLLSNLPIGAKIKFGKYSVNGETAQDIQWLVVAKNHSGYPNNSVTILTEKIIDLRAVDAVEPLNTGNRKDKGNSDYGVSNIDQWLNKDSPGWYSAAHSLDQAPNNTYVTRGTGYDTRPGFLNLFSTREKEAILATSISVAKYEYTQETLVRKVFLPSSAEVGLSIGVVVDGTQWSFFTNDASRQSVLTSQAYNNTLSSSKPQSITNTWFYWLRSAVFSTVNATYGVNAVGAIENTSTNIGDRGLRPAMNLASTQLVSDSTDSEGYYTVTWNSAPSAPTVLNIPNNIYGGKSNAISWNSASDPDGDDITYTLECSVNGGAYTELYSGASTAYAHIVPYGTTSVQYRVKATDPSNASSAYTTSTSRTVINNNAPVIDGSDSNLGVKSEEFSVSYKVTDANNNAVTVIESIDGVQIRSLVVTLGASYDCQITGNTWLAIPNGSHTLTIHATDGIDSSVRTFTFTKLVESFTIQNSTPWASATMPSRIMLVVTRNIPEGATFKVEVCNNGNDDNPTWEDATDAVRSGLVHVFTNKVKFAGQWGVLVRVSVNRNNATGACYVSAIGGNFE